MRILASAATAAAALVLLSGCITLNVTPVDDGTPSVAPSPAASIAPSPEASIPCTPDMLLNQPGTSYTITGLCGTVSVQGQDIQVTAEDIEVLTLNGDRISVVADDLGTLTISGNDIVVTSEDIGIATINGDRNSITADDIGTISVSGNDNSASGDDIGQINDSGSRNSVTARP